MKPGEMDSIGHRKAGWLLLALAAAANAAGYAFGLWHTPRWYDEAVHAFTTLALTLVLAQHLYGRVYTGARQHPVLLTLAVAAIGVAIGALWEVAEWAYDQGVPGNVILGKRDTILDLGYDTFGAVVAGAAATAMARREAG